MSHSFSNHFALNVMNRLVSAEIEAHAQAHSKPESDLVELYKKQRNGGWRCLK
jgi:hypothetical protein